MVSVIPALCWYALRVLPRFERLTSRHLHRRDIDPIRVTPGVLYVVGAGIVPVHVADAEVSAIQRAVTSGFHCEPLRSIPLGEPGSIRSGPLAGLSGTLVGVPPNLRLILSLSLLHRAFSVEVADSLIDCVESAHP
jgi:transcription antitermination factor NusG